MTVPHNSEDDYDLESAIADARLMITAFQTAGADYFDVTLKNLVGEKVKFHRSLAVRSLRDKLAAVMEQAELESLSVIIRPRSRASLFIQLDDINANAVQLIRGFSCLVLETSPENYQSFVVIPRVSGKAEEESIRRQLIQAVGADEGATGAARLAGSLNVKDKHRSPDGRFPRVRLVSIAHSRSVAVSELKEAGFIKDSLAEGVAVAPQPEVESKRRRRRPPVYEMAVQAVRAKHDGQVDRSAVDAHYAVVCLDWGFTFDETVDLLRMNSPKAAERSDDYVVRTVAWAQQKVATRAGRAAPVHKKRKRR
jgi:hypothetical protein